MLLFFAVVNVVPIDVIVVAQTLQRRSIDYSKFSETIYTYMRMKSNRKITSARARSQAAQAAGVADIFSFFFALYILSKELIRYSTECPKSNISVDFLVSDRDNAQLHTDVLIFCNLFSNA